MTKEVITGINVLLLKEHSETNEICSCLNICEMRTGSYAMLLVSTVGFFLVQ